VVRRAASTAELAVDFTVLHVEGSTVAVDSTAVVDMVAADTGNRGLIRSSLIQ
jgi:hypothetical protein